MIHRLWNTSVVTCITHSFNRTGYRLYVPGVPVGVQPMNTITVHNIHEIHHKMVGATIDVVGMAKASDAYIIAINNSQYSLDRGVLELLLRNKNIPPELLFALLEYRDTHEWEQYHNQAAEMLMFI